MIKAIYDPQGSAPGAADDGVPDGVVVDARIGGHVLKARRAQAATGSRDIPGTRERCGKTGAAR
jgi:hypothetical protein